MLQNVSGGAGVDGVRRVCRLVAARCVEAAQSGGKFVGFSSSRVSQERPDTKGLVREVLYLWVIFIGLVSLFTLIMLLPALAGPMQVLPQPSIAPDSRYSAQPGEHHERIATRQTIVLQQVPAAASNGVLVAVEDFDVTAVDDSQFGDAHIPLVDPFSGP